MKRIRQGISRRAFIKSASVGIAVPFIISSSTLGRDGRPAPSNRLTLGLIGLGSMGLRHVKGFLQEDDCEIIAVCDVDAGRLKAAAGEINKHYGNEDCARYHDFRELISNDEIDALCISVPDHWHSIPAIEGIRAGKDIYGEN
jgi:predicted dehydrogenase